MTQVQIGLWQISGSPIRIVRLGASESALNRGQSLLPSLAEILSVSRR